MGAEIYSAVGIPGKTAVFRDIPDVAEFLPLVGGRARRVLQDLRVNSVQQLLDLTATQVLAAHSSGAKTWEDIQKIQRLARKRLPSPPGPDDEPMTAPRSPVQEPAEPIPETSRGSFESLVRYWLTGSLAADRTIKIMKMRLGIGSEQSATSGDDVGPADSAQKSHGMCTISSWSKPA